MNFSEATTVGVLWKKLFLKRLQYSQESSRPANLLKRDSSTGVFPWIVQNFYEHLFLRASANNCFWFFKTATEKWWSAACVLTLVFIKLLTGNEQLGY